MDVRQYLRGKGIHFKEVKRPKGLQAVFNCPQCHENDFAVSITNGAFKCFHENKCGIQGSFYDFQKLYGDKPRSIINSNNFFVTKKVNYKKPKPNVNKLSDKAYKYLKGRGFSDQTIKDFKLAEKNGAIAYPFFLNGEIVNVKYRAIDQKKFWNEKDAIPILYNTDMCKDESILYITEGQDDAIALYEYGIKAVSLPNGVNNTEWIELQWEWLEQFSRIHLCFDTDKAGQLAVKNIANRLGKWRCYSVKFPYKDANDCLLNGVTGEDILNCQANSEEFNYDKLNRIDYYLDRVVELRKNKNRLIGVPTCFEGLTNILKGWRESEVTVWSGKNGSGKSTILNHEIISLSQKNEKVCVVSLEMPIDKLLNWMLSTCYQDLNDNNNDIELFRKKESLNIYAYDFVGQLKIEKIIDIFEFASRKWGCKHFIFDSMTKIQFTGNNEFQQQANFISNLTDFAKDYNAHVHVVVHPRKSSKDTDRPGKVDVGGSGHITNLAHNVITTYRPTSEEHEKAHEKGKELPDCILEVVKNREWGDQDFIKLLFDKRIKVFTEYGQKVRKFENYKNPEYFQE